MWLIIFYYAKCEWELGEILAFNGCITYSFLENNRLYRGIIYYMIFSQVIMETELSTSWRPNMVLKVGKPEAQGWEKVTVPAKQSENWFSFHPPFNFIQLLIWLDGAHTHRKGPSDFLSPLIQMLVFSRNTLTDIPRSHV